MSSILQYLNPPIQTNDGLVQIKPSTPNILQSLYPRRVGAIGGSGIIGAGVIAADNSLEKSEGALENYGGKHKKNPAKTVGIVIGVVSGILALIVLFFFFKRRAHKKREALARKEGVVVSTKAPGRFEIWFKRVIGAEVKQESKFGRGGKQFEGDAARVRRREVVAEKVSWDGSQEGWKDGLGIRGGVTEEKPVVGRHVVEYLEGTIKGVQNVKAPEQVALPGYRSLLPPIDSINQATK